MSQTIAIPRSHWQRYLKGLSARYLEQPLEVAVAPCDMAEAPMVHGLYLMGASLEGGRAEVFSLQMAELGRPDAHHTHRIPDPLVLLRELDDGGEIMCLVVEDRQRTRTSIAFRDTEPSPGPRHLATRRAADRCDHPRCLLASPDLGPPAA